MALPRRLPYSGKFSREKTFADRWERSISRRKLSRNVRTGCITGVTCLEFRGENFRGWLKNHEIRESFLPRKFPAIRYITVGPPGSSICQTNIITMVELCKRLGVPLADEKLVDACTCLTFLGIEIDTRLGMLRLPAEKLSRFKFTVAQWVEKKTCTKRELLSLIGQLQHASAVVRPGRPFMRQIIDLSKSVSKLTHHIRTNCRARSDIMWWHIFLETWNGVSLLSMAGRREPDASFASDASGSWGCGAY